MDPLTAFSTTTVEADRTFERAARERGLSVERHPYPAAGPDGEPLFTAVTRMGPADATNVVLLLSGVHGVEGFAGAGLQSGLLQSPEMVALPAEMALVLVHLVNPWGMAWNRREDHENIDVFRNLLYHDAPCEPDPLFDEIDDALDLPHWADPGRDDARRRALVDRYGLPRIVAAVRRGQHHRPKGMTYHGTGPCAATRTMHAIVDRQLAGVRRAAVIDVHTGFGAPGAGLVMSYEPVGTARYERARRWMEGDLYTPGTDFDIPAHVRAPYSFLGERVPGLEPTALILEFGTEPPDVTRDLFPANAYHHLFGDPRSDAARQVGARYRRFCYPETDEWKRAVWTRGIEVVRRVVTGLDRSAVA
jgi:hypothetical protein